MPQQRIKGQETSITIIRAGNVETELVDIQNFNYSVVSETKMAGYLGEKGERTDDIFKHVKFDLELHIHSTDWGAFTRAVVDRQQRNTPDVVFNLASTMFFPNGQTQTITIGDAKFGEIPVNVGSRDDYVKVKLDGVANDVVIVDQ